MRPPDLEQLRKIFDSMLDAARARDEQRFWHDDRAFHTLILKVAGNQRLAKYVDALREITRVHEAAAPDLQAKGWVDLAEEHRPILEAIEAADPKGAARRMLGHIASTAKRVLGSRALG
jgi:DNA-binding GntR family transcriptional regulator